MGYCFRPSAGGRRQHGDHVGQGSSRSSRAFAITTTTPCALPSVEKLPDSMTATGDRAEAVKNADIVVVAIAAQFARVAPAEF